MTLHEAIKSVLEKSKKPLKVRDIASAINEFALYKRNDGKAVSQHQVLARVKQYHNLFQINDDRTIELISELAIQEKEFEGWVKRILAIAPEQNIDIVVLFLVWLIRGPAMRENQAAEQRFDLSVQANTFEIKRVLLDALYSPAFESLPVEVTEELNTILRQCDFNPLSILVEGIIQFQPFIIELPKREFSNLLGRLLSQLSKGNRKGSGQHTTPQPISRFVGKLVHLQRKDKLCDPFAGSCMLVAEVISGRDVADVFVNEIDKRTAIVGFLALRLITDVPVTLTVKDAFDAFKETLFDVIVSNPPVALKQDKITRWYRRETLNIHPSPVGYIYGHLTSKGKAAVVIPDSFLYNSDKDTLEFRKTLLLRNCIKAVIALPAGIFKPYSSYSGSIVILDNTWNQQKIYFADLRNLSIDEFEYKLDELAKEIRNGRTIDKISNVIGTDAIFEDETLNLLPRKNLLHQRASSVDLSQSVRLGDLVRSKISGVTVPISNLNEEQDGVPYIRVSDLTDGASTVTTPLKFISDPDFLDRNAKKVEKGVILVARVGNNIKPCVYDSDEPAIASGNIISYKLDESKADPRFIVHELQSDYVKQQLENVRISGSGPSYLREKDLRDLRINVPSLELQRKYLNEHTHFSLSHLSQLKDQLQNNFSYIAEDIVNRQTINGQEKKTTTAKNIKEKEIISSIKHRISQFVSPLSSDLENLRLYHEQKSKDSTPVSLTDGISMRDNAFSIQQVFDRMKENLHGIGRTFELMNMILYYDEKSRNIQPCNVSDLIDKSYQSVKERMPDVLFAKSVDFPLDQDDLTIKIDEKQIEELLRNFFINFIKHGFDDTVQNKVIAVFLTKSNDDKFLELNLMNNGKPLPDNFDLNDFISFGSKGNVSDGTGIGGYLIKKIVDNHHGMLELIADSNFNMYLELDNGQFITFLPTVHFRVSLPYLIE